MIINKNPHVTFDEIEANLESGAKYNSAKTLKCEAQCK